VISTGSLANSSRHPTVTSGQRLLVFQGWKLDHSLKQESPLPRACAASSLDARRSTQTASRAWRTAAQADLLSLTAQALNAGWRECGSKAPNVRIFTVS